MRIAEARQWGWSAFPATTSRPRVGMCQLGAIGVAAAGAGFREILSHYYPNTQLITLP
ncbi:MAG: hypothetical protein ABSC77_09620 [Terracidiphilus sp.]